MKTIKRNTAILLIIEGLLLFVPTIVLGGAINWPASLGDPAETMLPLIHEQADAVRLGYFAYLIYSVLFFPVALMTARVVAGDDTFSPMLKIAVGFGAISTLARTLGIIRWLFPMPILAEQYVDPATSETARETIAIVYRMLNEYAGAVGEVIGVSFFAAIWIALIGIVILRNGSLPRWLGIWALVAAVGLASSILEMFGVDLGAFITVTVTIIQLWFLAAGFVLFRARN
ncbi:MAG: DUF4386 domain-containing protein [Aggregatilineales bacterium]